MRIKGGLFSHSISARVTRIKGGFFRTHLYMAALGARCAQGGVAMMAIPCCHRGMALRCRTTLYPSHRDEVGVGAVGSSMRASTLFESNRGRLLGKGHLWLRRLDLAEEIYHLREPDPSRKRDARMSGRAVPTARACLDR